MNRLNKKTKRTRICILIFACFFVFSFLANNAKAGSWGENLEAAYLEEMLAELYDTIQDMMLGAAKKAATETVVNSWNNLVSQSGLGGPLFIQKWDDELFFKPIEKAGLAMNDFFSSMTSGRDEPYDYVPGPYLEGCASGAKCVEGASISREGIVKGDAASNMNNNFYMFMRKTAENSIKTSDPQVNAYEYCQNPMNPVSGNNSNRKKCLSATAGKSFEISLRSQQKFYTEMEKQQQLAQVQAIAYRGFRAVETGGSVITPGSTVSDMLSQAENLGNLVIAGANSPAEIVSAVVVGIAERAIKSGIGQAQQMVQRELNQSINRAASEVRKANDPRTYFGNKY